ncbi:MAG: TonB-dependent receptor [Pyrinomonadaceae bacterium]
MGRAFLTAFFLLLDYSAAAAQPNAGAIRGTTIDVQGSLVIDAEVTLTLTDGSIRTTRSSDSGQFSFTGLAPGTYSIRVSKSGFAVYENTGVAVRAGRTVTLEVTLGVSIQETQVTVTDEAAVSTDPEAAAGAIVLSEKDLEALPDDPDDLEAALRALAGPGAGPEGGEIFIDGFSGGRLPPANTIREVRINQNPFSSEFDRLGFGRIEIFTKPGTDNLRGEVEFEFEDGGLNTRNPYSTNKPPFRAFEVSGNVGGPLLKNRVSYFFDAGYDRSESNALINAVVLGPLLNPVPLSLSVVTPDEEIEFSPRFDIEINERNTLAVRYSFERETSENSGVGGFSLPSRSFSASDTEHLFRLTETSVLSPTVVNETRFQYISRSGREFGDSGLPTIEVLDAFTGGGANIGDAFAHERQFELFNSTSVVSGRHTVKFGGRLRHFNVKDASPSNFAGTFTFTSLDQYRDAILDLPGGVPSQFSIAGGDPVAGVKQTDLGVFVQDDWRLDPKLTLSFGLRYENQSNISSNGDLAPRFAFAYAPGASPDRTPKTVIRGGIGIFYQRFDESYTLQASRFNGIDQQRFVITDPAILDDVVFNADGSVSNVPNVADLSSLPQTTRLVSPELRSPYTVQAAFGVERKLPFDSSVSASYIHASMYRLLRSRNINAPIDGIRPIPAAGNIFQYESTGRSRMHQFVVNARSRFADGFSIFANYSFSKAQGDTDGAGTFPANSYDLSGEFGDSSSDIRHRINVGGNFELPYGIELSPFVTYRTGIPFNITTGIDTNGDSLFTERPAFATDLGRQCNFGTETDPEIGPCVVRTPFGNFDRQPLPGMAIIPRNYGRGPDFFVTNLRVSREFEIGTRSGSQGPADGRGGGGGRRRGGINDPLAGVSSGGGPNRTNDKQPLFRLEVEVFFRNLFNTTNGGLPVGNLRSPFFGRSTSSAGGFGFGGGSSSAGNRRIEFEIEFGF